MNFEKKALKELNDLFQKYNQGNTPGIAVLVVQDLKAIFKMSYGQKNLSDHLPILPSSNFNLASVSKIFTGLSIALLNNLLIKPMDKLKKFFPQISRNYSNIEIQHLIHHTSGLPNYAKYHWDKKEVITNEQIISYLKKDELNFLPGERFEYNDTGYILLASLIEEVTKTSFSNFLTKNIFYPCGMKNTALYCQNENIIIPERVLGYTEWPFFELDDEYPGDLVYGDGGIYSSVEDLLQFILAIESEKLFTKEIKEKIFSYGYDNLNRPIYYGYGWYLDIYRGIKEFNHSGEWVGFRNHIAYFPEKKLWIVILANSSGIQARNISNRIVNIFLEN